MLAILFCFPATENSLVNPKQLTANLSSPMAEGIVEESLAKALVCLNVRASAWRPEPAGISFESKVIRDLVNYGRNFYACTGEKLDSLLALSVYERCEYLTKPVSTEEDVDVTAFDSNDDPSYIEYLATLDPTQWKNQDQYRVLGLSKLRYRASYPQIRASYRCKALLFHPDKRSSCAGETQVLTDDMFTCVTRAYETLSNPKTRLSYDCVDPENDDSVPPVCQNSRDNFFEIFADAFNRNSRWCSAPSVPQLGNPDDSEQQVNAFYSFWFEFPSWREFSWLDEENKATAESREERRWIEKMNRAARESHRKAEAKRIRTLVENAYKCDPRIKRFKEEEKKRREAIKEKKRLAKRQLEEEQLKLKAEETERQRKEKEAEEERVRQRVAEERRQKDAAKRALQREKKFLSDFVKERGYFASANFDQLAIMNDLGRLCSLMPLERLQSLNSSLKASTDVASSANCFRTFVNELDERLNAEKNYAAQSSSKTQGNDGESFDDPSWTKEETQLLVRAMRLFPAGTKSRWETIATFINEHKKYEAVRGAKTGKQVAAMAKRLQKVADDAKDTIADGNPLQAKGTVRAESSPTVRCDEKGKVADNKTESAASGTEIAPRAWTSDEQKLLEEGLKIYPSTLANRWDLIAERLPNRSKRECINRYKEIAEIVRAKKAALQKHSNGLSDHSLSGEVEHRKEANMGVVVVILLIIRSVVCRQPSVVSQFLDKHESRPSLRHMVRDSATGHLYVAGRNVLYRLDANLRLIQRIRTGPDLDSPQCNYNGDCILSGVVRSMTDNYNQILLIHPARRVLIACGTLFQGVCTVRRLDDLNKLEYDADKHAVPVAANEPNSSTAAFLGPGLDGNFADPVLYVGASFTHEDYREHFPAVCSRTLRKERLFQLVDPGDIAGQSAMVLKSDHRSDFVVHYKGGFVDNGYAYWVAVQRQSLDLLSPLRSKLLRVCTSDKRFESYSEIPLECLGPDNSNYNAVQAFYVGPLGSDFGSQHYFVGLFAKEPTGAGRPEPQSAICLFSMNDIRSAFWYNLQRCHSGIDTWNLPHFGLNQRCHNVSGLRAPPGEELCQRARVGGTIPATSIAAKMYDGEKLTSIAVDRLDAGGTVLLVGTVRGTWKKLLLESTSRAREYEEQSIVGDRRAPIKPDVLFDADRQHVYLMTDDEVLKVKIQSCSSHLNCTACIGSGDPYCGWCTLANSCMSKAECPYAEEARGFLATSSTQCPTVEAVVPANISFYQSAQAEVLVVAKHLPASVSGEAYKCLFGQVSVPAIRRSAEEFACNLPEQQERPKVTAGHDFVSVPLKIWSSRSGQMVVGSTFTFYDCAVHKLCTQCVQSRWRCDWCLEDSVCVRDVDVCSNQVRISHSDQLWRIPSLLHENTHDAGGHTALLSNSCPHVDAPNLFEVLLPDSHPTTITVPVVNLDKLTLNGDKRMLCVLTIEGHSVRVRAALSDNQKAVVCEQYAYTYDAQMPSISVELFLQTTKGTMIDKVKVTIYKCQMMASDCSRCLDLDANFECAWCDGGCDYRRQCQSPIALYPQGIGVCPAPVVEEIFPTMGPIEGGTRVEITGRDLGIKQSDVDGRVLVAGVTCSVTEYHTSEKVVCMTARSTHGPISGPVEVRLDNGRYGRSQNHFTFVDPTVVSYHPFVGPRSGGTQLVISGEHLLDATNVEVFVGNIPCIVQREKSTSRSLICLTSASPKENYVADQVTVRLDQASRIIASPFTYAPDPVITSISPSDAFRSGGRLLTVRGRYLDSVQRPLMYLLNRNGLIQSEVSICRVINNEKMQCPSPALIFAISRSKREETAPAYDSSDSWPTRDDLRLTNSQRYDLGFLMDHVDSLRHLSPELGFTIVPDPVYFDFPDGVRTHREGPLIIEGSNLNFGSSIRDIQVTIGSEPCNVTLLASTQLICQPTRRVARSADNGGRQSQGRVQVRVGNLHFDLGDLVYESPSTDSSNMALLGGLVGGICSLLFIVIVSAAVWWRKKSWLAEKEYRRIQLQMDTLESNVRQECKEAFAELQTDMSDLTSDLVALGIPFHSRYVYAARVLFKEDQRSVMQLDTLRKLSQAGTAARWHNAIHQFEQLLYSRQFVLCLIKALEAQPTFAAPEKVYVGSLLTAALMNNMQYLTEVVMALLRRLISKCAQSKHPQLMLRRTESVVEKMLANWIALCLYDYLQGPAGSSLFLLFKALKHQTEKGPIDAVTADARYCLSEDRLLKEQVDYEPVLLRVLPPQGDGSSSSSSPPSSSSCRQDPVVCRVLTCDAIRQVKAKVLDCLYRNTAYSAQPSVNDIDLEWHSRQGSILLREHMRTSDMCGRLNTVKDYRLPNNALIVVLMRTSSYTGYTDYSSHTYMSIDSSSQLLYPGAARMSRSSPPDNCERVGEGHFWHLIPPDSKRCGGTGSPSTIPEVYLTRLLSTKGTVQQFVDDFIASALTVSSPSTFPAPIKYLFDLLDEEAHRYTPNEAQAIAQAWKNNSLPLRFWVNIIKNPDFIFDVDKTVTVDSCLSVVAQAFMDACSPCDQQLNKDSPSNKLLFARDLPRYRTIFSRFYSEVRRLPLVSDQELNSFMAPLSKMYTQEWDTRGAVRELFLYALRYHDQVAVEVSRDPTAIGQRLLERFQQATSTQPVV
ncbi:hypothetical protein M514_03899 [Trichuris suis]|uniref:Uncharacterized protein n=1 Tax=Trichuris suis TaxID=68888 RepID=A0A085N8Z8_9BILA|nr:hypothetical protein M514_03899 [Trichuris suis]